MTSASFRRAPILGALLTVVFVIPALPACGRSEPGDFSDLDPGTGSGAQGSGAQGSGAQGSGGRNEPPVGSTGGASGRPDPGGAGSPSVGGTGVATGGSGPIGAGGEPSGGTGFGGGSATGGSMAAGGSATGGSATGGGAAIGGEGGASSAPGVTCGSSTCDSDTEACCVGLSGFGCIEKSASCNGAVLACASADDCADDRVCCLRVLDEPGTASECRRNCGGMGPAGDQQLCATSDECPNGRPVCRQTLLGVGICTRR